MMFVTAQTVAGFASSGRMAALNGVTGPIGIHLLSHYG